MAVTDVQESPRGIGEGAGYTSQESGKSVGGQGIRRGGGGSSSSSPGPTVKGPTKGNNSSPSSPSSSTPPVIIRKPEDKVPDVPPEEVDNPVAKKKKDPTAPLPGPEREAKQGSGGENQNGGSGEGGVGGLLREYTSTGNDQAGEAGTVITTGSDKPKETDPIDRYFGAATVASGADKHGDDSKRTPEGKPEGQSEVDTGSGDVSGLQRILRHIDECGYTDEELKQVLTAIKGGVEQSVEEQQDTPVIQEQQDTPVIQEQTVTEGANDVSAVEGETEQIEEEQTPAIVGTGKANKYRLGTFSPPGSPSAGSVYHYLQSTDKLSRYPIDFKKKYESGGLTPQATDLITRCLADGTMRFVIFEMMSGVNPMTFFAESGIQITANTNKTCYGLRIDNSGLAQKLTDALAGKEIG